MNEKGENIGMVDFEKNLTKNPFYCIIIEIAR